MNTDRYKNINDSPKTFLLSERSQKFNDKKKEAFKLKIRIVVYSG